MRNIFRHEKLPVVEQPTEKELTPLQESALKLCKRINAGMATVEPILSDYEKWSKDMDTSGEKAVVCFNNLWAFRKMRDVLVSDGIPNYSSANDNLPPGSPDAIDADRLLRTINKIDNNLEKDSAKKSKLVYDGINYLLTKHAGAKNVNEAELCYKALATTLGHASQEQIGLESGIAAEVKELEQKYTPEQRNNTNLTIRVKQLEELQVRLENLESQGVKKGSRAYYNSLYDIVEPKVEMEILIRDIEKEGSHVDSDTINKAKELLIFFDNAIDAHESAMEQSRKELVNSFDTKRDDHESAP